MCTQTRQKKNKFIHWWLSRGSREERECLRTVKSCSPSNGDRERETEKEHGVVGTRTLSLPDVFVIVDIGEVKSNEESKFVHRSQD